MNQTFAVCANQTFEDSLFSAGDSTRSLLTPLYASDYESLANLPCGEDDTLQSKCTNVDISEQACSQAWSACETERKSWKSSASHKRCKPASAGKQATPAVTRGARNGGRIEATVDEGQSHSYAECAEAYHFEAHTAKQSWEDWMLRKAILQVQSLKLAKEKKAREQLAIINLEQEKKMKQETAEHNRKQWLTEKMFLESKRKEAAEAQKEFEELKKLQEIEIVRARSTAKYEEWLAQKRALARTRKASAQKADEAAHVKMIAREAERKEAHKKWLTKVSHRAKSSPVSYGYSNGKLMTYYDMTASPEPTFRNPVPWVGGSVSEAVKSTSLT